MEITGKKKRSHWVKKGVEKLKQVEASRKIVPTWEATGRTSFWKVPRATVKGDCSYEIKRHMILGRKLMTNLDRVLESRDITLLTKVHIVKAIIFPVVIYGFENWSIRKLSTEELILSDCSTGEDSWFPWIARRSN